MRKPKQNSTGFAALEALLILIIIAIIGGTGYYVWHVKAQTDKTLNSAQAENTSAPTVKKSPAKTSPSTQQYFTIKEWGVRAPYNGTDTFTYKISGDDPSFAVFSSKILSTNYGCTDGGAGAIARYKATDEVQLPAGTSGGTVQQLIANGTFGSYTKVGDYYYQFNHDQAACSEKVTADAQNTASDVVKGFVTSLQAIPQ